VNYEKKGSLFYETQCTSVCVCQVLFATDIMLPSDIGLGDVYP